MLDRCRQIGRRELSISDLSIEDAHSNERRCAEHRGLSFVRVLPRDGDVVVEAVIKSEHEREPGCEGVEVRSSLRLADDRAWI